MERGKEFVLRHFEVLVVVVLVAATAFAVLVAVNKLAFLNFFYIPVLVASYFLGRKQGVLAALAAVLMVSIYASLNPTLFEDTSGELPYLNLVLWGGFTLLTAYVAGTLYEIKQTALSDLRQAYDGILEILAKFIDAVDSYTQDHSVRVAELAAETARHLGLSPAEVQDIQVAGLLHDVGKVDISLDVLRKASALTDQEWHEIRAHTVKGSAMLRPMGGLLRDVIPLVEAHHENFDGTGYHGMKGAEIPLGARILTVADAYDAMVCDRPYRIGRTSAEALREVEHCAGTQFDPEIVAAFKAVIQLRLVHHADEFPASARAAEASARA